MQAHVEALPLAAEHADQPRWRQAVARSMQEHCVVGEFDRCEIGRDAYPPIKGEVGIESVVVASAWLAFHVAAVVHFLGFGN